MTKLRFTVQTLALSVFMLALAAAAQAQATRTWVSGVGDDVNPCSRTAPCKTWAGAISKTAANGEIDALDPGGFGTLTITKSILVEGTHGQGFGSTLNSGGINGFVINDGATATPNTINVTLRNLSINGAGTTLGLNGIRFVAGKSLRVEHSRIINQSGQGIDVSLGAGTNAELVVVDTVISNVNGSAINMTTSGVLNAAIDGCVLSDSGHGLSVSAGTANISNSVVTGNTTDGIRTVTSQGIINASGNRVSHNGGSGISAVAGSTVRISDNDVSRNGTGLNNAGTMETFRNNRVRGNTTNLVGVLTDVSPVGTGIF